MIPLITNAVMQHQWLGVHGDHRYGTHSPDDAGPAWPSTQQPLRASRSSGLWLAGLVATAAVSLPLHLHYDGGQQIFFQFQHNPKSARYAVYDSSCCGRMIFAATITIAFTAFFRLQGTAGDHGIETDSKGFLFVYRHWAVLSFGGYTAK